MRRLAVAAALLTVAACSPRAPDPPGETGPTGHVHGLAVDPGDGLVCPATHTGLLRGTGARWDCLVSAYPFIAAPAGSAELYPGGVG